MSFRASFGTGSKYVEKIESVRIHLGPGTSNRSGTEFKTADLHWQAGNKLQVGE